VDVCGFGAAARATAGRRRTASNSAPVKLYVRNAAKRPQFALFPHVE
jgi:hypothetical protein